MGYLTKAGQKYKEALRRNNGNKEALNNWKQIIYLKDSLALDAEKSIEFAEGDLKEYLIAYMACTKGTPHCLLPHHI